MTHQARAVGGPLLTRPFTVLLGVLAAWFILLIWRFGAGIGAVSALSDGYPWGIWIAFDVVTGTALACGGYAVAILCYILNKGKYHPLVRPALLTSALGYSMAALAIIIDVGRPWFIWKIPIGGIPGVWHYNWNSALLEVALCVMAYVGVLWIELSPAFLEKWKDEAKAPWLRNFSAAGLKFFDKALIWIIALGILLPTMHQSSLGTVMLLAGWKLHPLWNSAMIPLLFLISCVGMGYGVVVLESAVSSRIFKRQRETSMLVSLSGAMVIVLIAYIVLRLADLLIQGKAALMFRFDMYSVLFWIEMALFIVPAVMLLRNKTFGTVMQAAILMILGGSMYRFDAYIAAYNPGSNWAYFPSVPELLITVGVITLEITLYIVIVKRFPILAGGEPAVSTR